MRLRKGIEIGETDIDLKKDLNNDESSNEKGNVIVLFLIANKHIINLCSRTR